MKRSGVFLSAVLGTLLFAIPAQSQAFFGFFGGGFSFGFGGGWSGWGGPGWWGPGYWGGPGHWGWPGYWGGPGYLWHRRYAWHHPYLWGHPYPALAPPFGYLPQVAAPPTKTPETSKDK